jgi:uncharacterized protein
MHAIYDKMRERGLIEGRLERYKRWGQKKNNPYWFYCALLSGGQFVLSPDGKIGFCHAGIMRDEDQFQRIDEIGDLYDNPRFCEWTDRTPLLIKECYLSCPYFSFCPGGCAYRVDELKGGKYSNAQELCVIEQFLIERAIIEMFEKN